MSDALFGVDGTELPKLEPDRAGRGGWRDAPPLPPFTLPPAPDTSVLREAVAAALGEDPTESVDQDPGAAPVPERVAPPSVTPTQSSVSPTQSTASPPTESAPQPGRAAAPGHRTTQLVVPAPVGPAPPPPRKVAGLGYRPPLAAAARTPVRLADLRRRVGRRGPSVPLQTRSNGGAGALLVIALIIFGVLVYNIIAGIVEAITRLLP
jgi:hypothetical protein